MTYRIQSKADPGRTYELFRPESIGNPYPDYIALRQHDPVAYSETAETWIVTRYEPVWQGLRDKRFSSARSQNILLRMPESARPQMDAALQVLRKWMLFQDAPDHTRLRLLVAQAFTPRLVERLRPRLERLTRELLEQAGRDGTLELMSQLAVPLPLSAIGELMGVPREDHARLKRWSDGMARLIAKIGMDQDEALSSQDDLLDMVEYFRQLVQVRRDSPGGDLVSSMIRAQDGDRLLSPDELLATCCLMLAAGHETTTNLIGNGFLALWRHPDQLAKLRREPELVPAAVEEMLRFDGPAHMVSRVALADVTLCDRRIQEGDRVIFVLGAANRDPDSFPDPERFDVTRTSNKHVSFGAGVHFCLGAPLARLETQIALNAALERFPRMRLESTAPRWRRNSFIRGVEELWFSI
jgi:cytochrome P450